MHRWKDNIKTVLIKVVYDRVNWIIRSQDGRCLWTR